jgi:outer membrane protein
MKKAILFFAIMAFAGVGQVMAQKFGHINSQDLLALMPEMRDAETKLEALGKEMESSLQSMSAEYQGKVAKYQAAQATFSETQRELKESEINDLGTRIQNFQVSAEQRVAKKRQEWFQPILDKAKDAIEIVGKENGFTYIFDSSVGVTLYEGGEDVIQIVKKKLNLQ